LSVTVEHFNFLRTLRLRVDSNWDFVYNIQKSTVATIIQRSEFVSRDTTSHQIILATCYYSTLTVYSMQA